VTNSVGGWVVIIKSKADTRREIVGFGQFLMYQPMSVIDVYGHS